MLQNMADAAKLDIALDLEKEVFSGFKYDSGKVWEKVAPREKESDTEDDAEEEEKLEGENAEDQYEEEFEEIDEGDPTLQKTDDDKK